MIKRPRFAPWLRVCVGGADGVLLISERYQRLLLGRVACLLASLIDGRRRSDELVDLLAREAPAAEVYQALIMLEKHGYLVEADGPSAGGPVAFWGAASKIPQEVAEADLGAGASLFSFGAVPSTAAEALAALGLTLRDGADFAVVLTDDYLRDGLDDFNRAALKRGRPWLICKPVGSILWIGPIFRPGKSGCWECLASRLRDKRPHERYLAQKAGSSSQVHIPQLSLASTLQTGLGLAATETARWLACGQSPLEGVLVTFDSAGLSSEHHELVRRPQCPNCGDAEYQSGRTPEPARPRTIGRENGAANGVAEHGATPEATLARFGHHVSPLTGIVSNLRRLSSSAGSLGFYAAESNILRRSDTGSFSRPRLRNRSFGKGTTDAEARSSALCEALERHSAYAQGYEPRVCASLRELGDTAIHPNDCMLFSDQQYRNRSEWNATASMAQFVPEPFDPDAQIDWAPVWSLTRGDWRHLPSQYCYYDYPIGEAGRFCRADSNGNAAGYYLEESILRGFFELVERDCVAIWWYNRIKRPAVDLSSFADPYIEKLLRSYRAMGRDVWALDLTNDLGIPAFVAVSRQTGASQEGLVMGFGASLDARAGMVHALTEMNQFLGLMLDNGTAAGEDDATRNPELETWWKSATLTDHPYLAPDRKAGLRTARSYPAEVHQDSPDAIGHCQAIVRRLGLELLVLDLTRPDIGLSVVKVIVPGLRHFWRRVGPGRLYDVPVKLGWLDAPPAEEQLNPTSVFL